MPNALHFRPIPDLDEGWRDPRPGPRLAEMRARCAQLNRYAVAYGPGLVGPAAAA